jgi:subtilisin family serine protease
MTAIQTGKGKALAAILAVVLGTGSLIALDTRHASAQFDLGSGLRALGGMAGQGGQGGARPGQQPRRPNVTVPQAGQRGTAGRQQRNQRPGQQAPQQAQPGGLPAAIGGIGAIAPVLGAIPGANLPGGGALSRVPGLPGGGGRGILPPGLPGIPGLPGGGGGGGGRNAIIGAAAAAIAVPAILSIIEHARANADPGGGPIAANEPPGLPPRNERRFIPGEVLFIMAPDAPRDAVRRVVRRFNLTLIEEVRSEMLGTNLYRYRVPNRLTVPAAIRAMQAEAGVAYVQPNYAFDRPEFRVRLESARNSNAGTGAQAAAPRLQYVIDTLRLTEAHQIARGERVAIAVIDSGVDATHPELAGRVVQSFDAVGGQFRPHEHGTGMAGAIVAHSQLLGVSPRADIYAVRAFAPGQSNGSTGTSFHIVKAMDWSIRSGARVINMSFAGPRDPMIARAIQVAADRRIAMVAAMGNGGPDAPIAFPAADPNVIAVTATDQQGRLFDAATRGDHVAVAAPGVEILLPAPRGGYQISSGTSVAAAHISGVAALILERHPEIDPAGLRRILQETARQGEVPDPKLGAGVADPVRALAASPAPMPAPAPIATAPAEGSPQGQPGSQAATPAPAGEAAPATVPR